MKKADRTEKAYAFLRANEGKQVTIKEMSAATGWSESTIKTYIRKKWNFFTTQVAPQTFLLQGLERITLDDFFKIQSQVISDFRPTGSSKGGFDYDVALSFAGEDRNYVEKVASYLTELGIRIFYDRFEEAELLGKNLVEHFDRIYQHTSRHCAMFISEHYVRKLWPTLERQNAQTRAFRDRNDYILPFRFDDTPVPGLPEIIGYMSANQMKPEQVGYAIAKKLGKASELDTLFEQLKEIYPEYEIATQGTNVHFELTEEEFSTDLPLRLLLEMSRAEMLEEFLINSSVLPRAKNRVE